MISLNKKLVLLVGVVFHVAFMWSIFDIYFVSPLIHGMKHHQSTATPPAKRLFLIVGDGLRADKAFEKVRHPTTGESEYLAPFLRSKVMSDATFGISHTRMPTESRPGHVALIAGFYEDVSAVTKGWKENPVDFDSVFNQSRHTYSLGSPDILPMFKHGAEDQSRIDAIMYGHDFEDFTKGSIELDAFVFDHLDEIFENSKTNKTLDAQLRSDKTVFFLHLLGIDTAGHSYRPYSAEYYDNIKYIDENIGKLVDRVNKFYNDDEQTAWVFTADHGMSDWGSHGDGHPDNTRTPLIAWGAGVNKPIPASEDKGNHDEYSEVWDLPVKRNDVNQADIASLMSYLVGLNYPSNSVGELPLAFVDASSETKARAIRNNALALVEQYLVKEEQQRGSQIIFKPYPPLSDAGKTIDERLKHIDELIAQGLDQESIVASEELMGYAITGLKYLQTYNWLFLRTLVTFGFFGWIAVAFCSYLMAFVVRSDKPFTTSVPLKIVAYIALATLSGFFIFQKAPLHYHLYAVFPVVFWEAVLQRRTAVAEGISILAGRSTSKVPALAAVLDIGLSLVLLEAIVYGYFHREIFSVCFGLATLWPFVHNWTVAKREWPTTIAWVIMCGVMSSFTLLEVVKVESIEQILLSGALMLLIGLAFTVYLNKKLALAGSTVFILFIQIILVVATMYFTKESVESLTARNGLPLFSQVGGWIALLLSLVVPFLHFLGSDAKDYRLRLLIIFLAFGPTFVILTISWEGFFYVCFFAILVVWIELETQMRDARVTASTRADLTPGDFRMALFTFFMSQIGFFGIGNIASISSFSLDSVYRLIPVFDPFSMGALLMFKILVPFAVLSACLGILNLKLGVPSSALFSMVLCVSDILTLNFFYLVVDEGSWLDIGTGISHYCIASGLSLFMMVLEYLSGVLVAGVAIAPKVTKLKKDI